MNLNAEPKEEKTDGTVTIQKSQGHIEEVAPVVLEEPSIEVEVVIKKVETENEEEQQIQIKLPEPQPPLDNTLKDSFDSAELKDIVSPHQLDSSLLRKDQISPSAGEKMDTARFVKILSENRGKLAPC